MVRIGEYWVMLPSALGYLSRRMAIGRYLTRMAQAVLVGRA